MDEDLRTPRNKPIWPINAVSIREAIGSAVNASAEGRAMFAISRPSSSFLKTFLEIPIFSSQLWIALYSYYNLLSSEEK